MPRNTEFDKPLLSKILPGKKRTYIDDAVKEKAHVPAAKYEIISDIINVKRKSNLDKGPRNTLADDIANYNKKNSFPAPVAYSPNHSLVIPNDQACLKFKAERGSYLGEAMYKGSISPNYRISEHKLVEPRVRVHSYMKRNKPSTGPDFLKSTVASKLISPVTYHATESFNKTQTYKVKFFPGKTRGKTMVDDAVKRAQGTPGAGHYDIKNIERAYTRITMGASRGWK